MGRGNPIDSIETHFGFDFWRPLATQAKNHIPRPKSHTYN